MQESYLITDQVQLDTLQPVQGLPLSISFTPSVKIVIRESHIPVLLHNGVEILEVRSFVFVRGSKQRFFETVLNHCNLKKLELTYTEPTYLIYRFFYRSSVSSTLTHLYLNSLSVTERDMLFVSRAIASNFRQLFP